MESAWSSEVTLRIGDGNFKWSVANAERLHIHKHKQLRRLAKFGIAFVERHRRDGGILLRATVQIIIHRIAAQFRDAPGSHGIDSSFRRTLVNRQSLQVSRERSSSG